MSKHPAASALSAAWQAFWSARQPRERQLLALAAWVVGTALLWQITIAPALHTWREAPLKQATLDAQTTQMRQLQAQARGLQTRTPLTRSAALQWLETSAAESLGPEVRVSLQGEQVRITLKAAPAEGLSRWLAQARSQAQALPVQAQLQRVTSPSNASTATSPVPAVWSGTLVMNLR